MGKDWYVIDVKEKVFKELKDEFSKYILCKANIDVLKKYSTRDLMEGKYLENIFPSNKIDECKKFVKKRFFYYRSRKYGNEDFWNASSKERDIAYQCRWHTFIRELISRYCKENGKILFVGTANGNEIPFDNRFSFYALEQLNNSVRNIDTMKCKKIICGDFEDETLLIDDSNGIDVICALRCMTPNTRIEKFLQFADRNLKKDGVIIISYPMGYLDKDNLFKPLPEAKNKLVAFTNNISRILSEKTNYTMEKGVENIAESFFFLKRKEI